MPPRSRFCLLLTAMLVCLAPAAACAAISGEELLKRCSASEKSMRKEKLSAEELLDSTWCSGYISGLLDGFSVGDFKVGDAKAVCPPEAGLTRSDALKVILQWLREHPEEQAKSGRRGAIIALTKSYGCGGAPAATE